MAHIQVDFSAESAGKIRPLHGVNAGPMTKVFTYDARPLFREAGFPFARLHDIEYPYGSGEFVDIPCIFKNFDADEMKEENYNFGLTDAYLEKCVEVGCEPFFRLGVSIEHAPVKRYVYPPKDFAKWARICEHIIRHYTEGWAKGFRWNIRYWEIWNEADSCANGGTNMWLGTPAEFYELYCISASHLKECFPHLKIGGCGFTRGCNPFIEDFFRYITSRDKRIPLDFFSWHRYFTDVQIMRDEAAKVDDLLQRYGYTDTESIFDEWNYMRDWKNQADSYVLLKNHVGAAYCAAVLCAMQTETNIGIANYFEADVVKEWCGIMEVDKMSIGAIKATVAPRKPFYAFKAFHMLYTLQQEKHAVSDTPSVYAAAASDGNSAALLAVNYDGENQEIAFDLMGLPAGEYEVRIVDETKNFERVMTFAGEGSAKITLALRNNSLVYIGSVQKKGEQK